MPVLAGPLSKDLVAASATPLILSILANGDSYGYALLQAIRDVSDGELEWADGMLYPILHRLEKRGLIESWSGTADNGRRRRYYRLQPEGENELQKLRRQWRRLLGMFDAPALAPAAPPAGGT